MVKNKNITIKVLAIMIEKGFDEAAKKEQVNNLEEQVNNLEGWAKRRFDNIDGELKSIRKQLTGIVLNSTLKCNF